MTAVWGTLLTYKTLHERSLVSTRSQSFNLSLQTEIISPFLRVSMLCSPTANRSLQFVAQGWELV